MPERSATEAAAAASRRFLISTVDDSRYAFPTDSVLEVIRVPRVARVPKGPKGLVGIASLRGAVLPVASLRELLGRKDTGKVFHAPRAIVLDMESPVAIAVDGVDSLVTIDAGAVLDGAADLSADEGERLQGMFMSESGLPPVKILDAAALLKTAFAQRSQAPRRQHGLRVGTSVEAAREIEHEEKLVTFEIAGQEYAVALDDVREIVPAPDYVMVPRAETLVLGVANYRDMLLPLLSMRGLLGFGSSAPDSVTGQQKVIVVSVRGAPVGLVVDRMRAIVRAEPDAIDPVPPVLLARAGGESAVKAIYRGEGGTRLISILATEQLFRDEIMRRLERDHAGSIRDTAAEEAAEEGVQFLVFRLGDGEFALPIDVIDEVARVPERVARLPKTPSFLEGVINLRGDVLPVVDQRRRFDMPQLTGTSERRLIVVRTDRHRAGLIVDSVSEILRIGAAAVQPAPELTGTAARLLNGIINLEANGRIVLLLDPGELLSRAEQDLLDAFQTELGQVPA